MNVDRRNYSNIIFLVSDMRRNPALRMTGMKGQSLRVWGNIENQDGLSDKKTTLLFRVLSKETREICGGCEKLWYDRKEERRKLVGSCKHEEESMFANKVVMPGHLLFAGYQQPTSRAKENRKREEEEQILMNFYVPYSSFTQRS